MKITCDNCLNIFNRKPSEINITGNFCCKLCHSEHKKNLNIETKKINRFIKSKWTNMNIRAGKYRHLQTKDKCLHYNGINILFNREEFSKWCFTQKDLILKLMRPSIDRIDNLKDYTFDNLQIIELTLNIGKEKLKHINGYCVCSCCNIKKPTEDYSKDSRRKIIGRNTICKICDNKR